MNEADEKRLEEIRQRTYGGPGRVVEVHHVDIDFLLCFIAELEQQNAKLREENEKTTWSLDAAYRNATILEQQNARLREELEEKRAVITAQAHMIEGDMKCRDYLREQFAEKEAELSRMNAANLNQAGVIANWEKRWEKLKAYISDDSYDGDAAFNNWSIKIDRLRNWMQQLEKDTKE